MPHARPLVLGLSLVLAACPSEPTTTPTTEVPPPHEPPSDAEPPPELDIAFLREHTRVLAADEFEGRLPGSEGARKTVAHIVAVMQEIGLEPAGEAGGWTQTVRMRGVTVDQANTAVELIGKGKGKAMPLRFGEAWVGSSFAPGSEHPIDAELVFVGYGITAPEQGWDDYAKVDVRGKIAVVFVGDPPLDDGRFGGPAMTYYGRWSYKFEAALAAGASGCLVIHEEGPASYGWNVPTTSFSSERFTILGPQGAAPALAVQGWISSETADALAKRGGQSLAKWHEIAMAPKFKPIALRTRMQGNIVTSERTVEDVNVLGRLPGAEAPAQSVMITAHWDHLGRDAKLEAEGHDGIHNGAIDNASGIAAMLGVAAELATQDRLDRSVVFLATTAEEQGLLGSRAWVASPTIPHDEVVAVINLDSMNVHGESKQVEVVGWGQTTIEDLLIPLAEAQGRKVVPDSKPEAGSFYRSDHFPFAQVGIPALYFHAGPDMVEGGHEAGESIRASVKQHYHTPGDEFDEAWSFAGALQDAKLVVALVQALGEAGVTPVYRPTSEFVHARAGAAKPE